MNTLCGQNVGFVNVKLGGTNIYRFVSKVYTYHKWLNAYDMFLNYF